MLKSKLNWLLAATKFLKAMKWPLCSIGYCYVMDQDIFGNFILLFCHMHGGVVIANKTLRLKTILYYLLIVVVLVVCLAIQAVENSFAWLEKRPTDNVRWSLVVMLHTRKNESIKMEP